jgi:hypothetical protein
MGYVRTALTYAPSAETGNSAYLLIRILPLFDFVLQQKRSRAALMLLSNLAHDQLSTNVSSGLYYAFLLVAHRLRCASAMRFRPTGLIFRFVR